MPKEVYKQVHTLTNRVTLKSGGVFQENSHKAIPVLLILSSSKE
jgi:hypothetical protein